MTSRSVLRRAARLGRAGGIFDTKFLQHHFSSVASRLPELKLAPESAATLLEVERAYGVEVFGVVYPEDEIWVTLVDPKTGKIVGYFEASVATSVGLRYLEREELGCGMRWRKMGKPVVWAVSYADVAPSWQRKGIATRVYEAIALHVLSQGAVLVQHACVGGATSGRASKVWTALCREFVCMREDMIVGRKEKVTP